MFLTDALLSVLYPQRCRICGGSVERHRFGVACEVCWNAQVLTEEGAIGWYEGALRETILLLKREPFLPRHLRDLMKERANSMESITRVVPVPLHEERLRSRGFNQAGVIGREVSKALGVPLDEVSLIRVSSPRKYRAGLDARGRRESVEGAFTVRYPRLIAGEEILLVDDVFTTGATVGACEEALLEAGAKSVLILTLARARHS
ncbi:MAG TPA: ComF family protein [Pyrinomonadaceae bacterium]|nr:ComF family protein [Pyrinomonadaceae bacterium]